MTEDMQLMRPEGGTAAVQPAQNVETAAAVARAVQEVQASMIIAKRFPRDETAAFSRLMRACKRTGLADAALYEYERGGTKVEGPSIRLAEAAAQAWGNLTFGVTEVEQRKDGMGVGESVVEAYCHDLETNTRQVKRFHVPHVRDTRAGRKMLTDARDIYETVANQGARRLRACILGVIPGDVIDSAVSECNKTLAGQNSEPLADRIRKMVTVFGELGVTPAAIEAKLNHKVDACSENEVAKLRKTFQALKDGMTTTAEQFPALVTAEKKENDAEAGKKLADRVGKGKPKDAPAETTAAAPAGSKNPDDGLPY